MLIIGANADPFRPVGCKACPEGIVVNEAGATAREAGAHR